MSEQIKRLAIPSHLRLDTLSLSCISTGLTPKGEVKSAGLNRGALSARSVGGKYTDFDEKVPLQLPTSRSLRTSQRVNRSSVQLFSGSCFDWSGRTTGSKDGDVTKKPLTQESVNKNRIHRGYVTTPKGFEFATNERAEQRLRHQRSSSSGSFLYGGNTCENGSSLSNINDLNLNIHHLNCGRLVNPPISARSCSSIGAESRMSSRSRLTTIPKPFHFETDIRASNKSKILSEKLDSLKEKFNEAVFHKNREFNEDRRLRNIIESIRSNNTDTGADLTVSSSCTKNKGLSGEGYSSSISLRKDECNGEWLGARNFGRRGTTIPKSPKFATRMRSESKRAQLRSVLDSLLLNNGNEGFEPSTGKGKPGDERTKSDKQMHRVSDIGASLGREKGQQSHNAKTSSLVSENEKVGTGNFPKLDKDNTTQRGGEGVRAENPQVLPKLRGFLSMNSFSHLGRQSLGSSNSIVGGMGSSYMGPVENIIQDRYSHSTRLHLNGSGEGLETARRSVEEATFSSENNDVNSSQKPPTGVTTSVRKASVLENNVPSNWKFQATVARKQLQQLIDSEDVVEFFPLDHVVNNHISGDKPEPSNHIDKTVVENERESTALLLNGGFSEEDLRTPLPRTFR